MQKTTWPSLTINHIIYFIYCIELNGRLKALTLGPQRILLPTTLSKRLHDDENIKLHATE